MKLRLRNGPSDVAHTCERWGDRWVLPAGGTEKWTAFSGRLFASLRLSRSPHALAVSAHARPKAGPTIYVGALMFTVEEAEWLVESVTGAIAALRKAPEEFTNAKIDELYSTPGPYWGPWEAPRNLRRVLP